MKKILTFMLSLFMFSSLSACSLYAGNKELEENYQQSLLLLDDGKEVEAYRLLYQAKEYAPAQAKLRELLAKDYSLQYRAAEVGHTVQFGRYEQDNNTANGKEPIEWTVLKTSDNRLMLAANRILDYCKYYEETSNKYTWTNSSLCGWLNGEFSHTSFLESERDMLCESTLTTYEAALNEEEISVCKIFLLSKKEYEALDYSIKSTYLERISETAYANNKWEKLKNSGSYKNNLPNRKAVALRSLEVTGMGNYVYVISSENGCKKGARSLYYNGIAPVVWIEY